MPAYIPGTEALAADVAPLLEVVEGGQAVSGSAQIISFTGDAAVAASELTTTEVVVATGNGAAQTATLVVGEGAGGAAVTSGLAVGAVPLSVALPAIALALGATVAVSSHIYPDEWQQIGDALTSAGRTIGGKVRCFLGQDGNTYYDQDTIEAIKNFLCSKGIFSPASYRIDSSKLNHPERMPSGVATCNTYTFYTDNNHRNIGKYTVENARGCGLILTADGHFNLIMAKPKAGASDNIVGTYDVYDTQTGRTTHSVRPGSFSATDKEGTQYYYYRATNTNPNNMISYDGASSYNNSAGFDVGDVCGCLWKGYYMPSPEVVDPSSIIPDEMTPFPQTYPDWQPFVFPPEITNPGDLPTVFPVEIPELNPSQEESQEPNPLRYPDILPNWIRKITEFPEPYPEVVPYPAYQPDPAPFDDPAIVPEPDPDPNPSPSPEQEPVPEVDPYNVPEGNPDPLPQNDPINPTVPSNIPDPNPTPPTDTVPAVLPIPSTVSSNKLFTVYAPTMTQLNQLGGFLWSTSIIDELKKIWQDPLDGVIKLHKIYAVPDTGSSQNIILGTIDSGVPALVVTNQYKEYNLGSISVSRFYNNILDYAPFTSIGIFLPFIGFKELNTNEIMGGMITVKYKVDIYTGVCIAQILVSRQPDIPAVKVLYTFVGNMSQEIPLTALTQRGLYTSILEAGVAVGGLAATGGASALQAASSIGHAALREMNSVERCGNLSSNAGIMGEKYAYLIIRRRKGYDANSYNTLYGYPANKTMMLGNCKGYTKVKYVQLETAATQEEKNELEALLKGGVLL